MRHPHEFSSVFQRATKMKRALAGYVGFMTGNFTF
jgi:hypothetical protein